MSLCIPEKILAQHLVVLGKTGSGKSSKLRVIVEHLLDKGKRVCVIDPKGDWWGLKVSADGKSAGYPVVLFGDFKNPDARDVPINDRSGRHIAGLIATGNRPCVIGLRGWTQGGMTRFWIDFASTIFAENAGELYIVGDEFHNFAPKQWKGVADKDNPAGVGLHWANRLLSEGRGLGLVCLIASQRPQKVHNDTLTSCETLMAARVVHPADRDAVDTWISGNGDPELAGEVLGSLAGMPREEAWVWSPEVGFGPKRIAFPMFATFDSFAPPQLQKRVSNKGWASVDLTAVQEKLAQVIEEENARDPKMLRSKIAELQKQLAAKPAPAAPAKPEVQRVGVPIVTDAQVKSIETVTGRIEADGAKRIKAAEDLAASGRELIEAARQFAAALGKAKAPEPMRSDVRKYAGSYSKPTTTTASAGSSIRTPTQTAPRLSRAPSTVEGSPEVGKGGIRRIMIALAQRPGLSKRQIGVRARLSSKSGTFDTYISTMRKANWLTNDQDSFSLTDDGLAALGSYTPLPSGSELLSHWLNQLGNSGASRMLTALANAWPNELTKPELGEAAEMSSESGTFDTYLSKLKTLELIQTSKAGIKASDELFAE